MADPRDPPSQHAWSFAQQRDHLRSAVEALRQGHPSIGTGAFGAGPGLVGAPGGFSGGVGSSHLYAAGLNIPATNLQALRARSQHLEEARRREGGAAAAAVPVISSNAAAMLGEQLPNMQSTLNEMERKQRPLRKDGAARFDAPGTEIFNVEQLLQEGRMRRPWSSATPVDAFIEARREEAVVRELDATVAQVHAQVDSEIRILRRRRVEEARKQRLQWLTEYVSQAHNQATAEYQFTPEARRGAGQLLGSQQTGVVSSMTPGTTIPLRLDAAFSGLSPYSSTVGESGVASVALDARVDRYASAVFEYLTAGPAHPGSRVVQHMVTAIQSMDDTVSRMNQLVECYRYLEMFDCKSQNVLRDGSLKILRHLEHQFQENNREYSARMQVAIQNKDTFHMLFVALRAGKRDEARDIASKSADNVCAQLVTALSSSTSSELSQVAKDALLEQIRDDPFGLAVVHVVFGSASKLVTGPWVESVVGSVLEDYLWFHLSCLCSGSSSASPLALRDAISAMALPQSADHRALTFLRLYCATLQPLPQWKRLFYHWPAWRADTFHLLLSSYHLGLVDPVSDTSISVSHREEDIFQLVDGYTRPMLAADSRIRLLYLCTLLDPSFRERQIAEYISTRPEMSALLEAHFLLPDKDLKQTCKRAAELSLARGDWPAALQFAREARDASTVDRVLCQMGGQLLRGLCAPILSSQIPVQHIQNQDPQLRVLYAQFDSAMKTIEDERVPQSISLKVLKGMIQYMATGSFKSLQDWIPASDDAMEVAKKARLLRAAEESVKMHLGDFLLCAMKLPLSGQTASHVSLRDLFAGIVALARQLSDYIPAEQFSEILTTYVRYRES